MKYLSFKKVVLSLAVASVLAGCSQSNQVKSMEAKMDEYDKIEDRVNKRAQQRIDVAPDWYLNAKSSEHDAVDLSSGVYGVSSHYSKDMEIAFDDATSLALGDAVRKSQMTMNMLKQSVRAGSGADQRNVFNRMQEELVKRVGVSGYKVVEREIRTEKGGYRAFIKVFVPTSGLFAESERKLIKDQIDVMRNAIKVDDDAEAKKAVDRYNGLNSPDLTVSVNKESVPVVEVIPLPPLSQGGGR